MSPAEPSPLASVRRPIPGLLVVALLAVALAGSCERKADHDQATPKSDKASAAAGEKLTEAAQPPAEETVANEMEAAAPATEPAAADPAMQGAPAGAVADEAEEGGELQRAPEAPDSSLEEKKEDEAGAEAKPSDQPDDGKAKQKEAGGKERKDTKTWKRAAATANASRLVIGDYEDLPLEGVQVHIHVDGHRARVLADYYYFNDRDRQLEGTFKLRLPDGASPFFLAFGQTIFESTRKPEFLPEDSSFQRPTSEEILSQRQRTWQEPRVARMVQKEKAAFAYEDTVRRSIDPALMEWAGPGVFSTRVFPLAPQQLHRIVVGYDVDLTWLGNDLELAYDLPDLVQHVVDVTVSDWSAPSIVVTPGNASEARQGIKHWRIDGNQATTVKVRLDGVGSTLMAGDDPAGPFFAASVVPELPRIDAAPSPRAVFVVDTSLSANPDQFNVWLALMRAVLENNRDSLTQFAVLFFNVETAWYDTRFIENTPENLDKLFTYANALALEGATDLAAALREAAAPAWITEDGASWDVFLLSDAASTWGEADAHRISASLRGKHARAVFGYRTGLAGTDSRMLDHLARTTGGAVFAVAGEAEIQSASTAHRARPWLLREAGIDGASDVLLAGRPTAIFPGQRLLVVGRGTPAPDARLRLVLAQGDAQQTVDAPLARHGASHLTARVYGAVAVGQLEEFKASTEPFSVAYARHFRVTGASASLLMLESEEEYARYGIRPEADQGVVVEQLVSAVVANAELQLGALLGDPRAAFFDMLQGLERMEGLGVTLDPQLWKTLKDLPVDAFEVDATALQARQHTWGDTAMRYREALAKRDISYDEVTQEAQRRLVRFGGVDALKALSSLVEHSPGDAVLARDIAYQALEWGQTTPAYHLLRRVAVARPYEPQTYHALALTLAKAGRHDLAMAYFELALAGQWNPRFGAFRQIVSLDYLRFLGRVASGEAKLNAKDFALSRRQALLQSFPIQTADLLVTIGWNTDRTDVDLHVIEPSGEECYYSHPNTAIGGSLTQDVTTGYGPEMYKLDRAVPGTYQIRVKYFASDANRASTRTKVYATVIEGWGTSNEKVTEKVVTLASGKEMHDILTVRR